ncbi:hypothetical protein MVEN_00925900 [Mycena venus]|uniref:Uncharacterized protein n=1 Tax=Mycena venus TaxID=2733690 RepID=A0A8H6Y7Z3_9AGAR|nr:hypothetical protein MVEN_00925900 [Mycena venus]
MSLSRFPAPRFPLSASQIPTDIHFVFPIPKSRSRPQGQTAPLACARAPSHARAVKSPPRPPSDALTALRARALRMLLCTREICKVDVGGKEDEGKVNEEMKRGERMGSVLSTR